MSAVTTNAIPIPDPLVREVEARCADLAETDPDALAILNHPDAAPGWRAVWAASPFVAETCRRHPNLLFDLCRGDLRRAYDPGELVARIRAEALEQPDEDALAKVLRLRRAREMVRIAWRDLAGLATLEETLGDLSDLADGCIDGALRWIERAQAEEWGVPHGESGEPQRLVVLGMGKLGGRELNYSSDIDLICAFPEAGETRGRREVSNTEYFTRVVQRLARALEAQTAEGFVFRVDLRLRPYGDSGPVVMSFAAMEDYYQSQGRDWERYAMIKARVVAGDAARGAALLAALKPFMYRKYLDFGAFESIREMKGMIERELARKGMEDNIKLGAGGIREIEFIGQAFQLIRGGRVPALQSRSILAVLARLGELKYLPEHAVSDLVQAYHFLRDAENRIQMQRDQQTHLLPRDDLDRARLAHSMGFADWDAFRAVLKRHRDRVQGSFEQVFAAPQEAGPAEAGPDFRGVWTRELGEAQALEQLRRAGYEEPEEVWKMLAQLREAHRFRTLGPRGRERLERLMPLLLAAVAGGAANRVGCLRRLLALIETVLGRTAYLALLVENPMALSQLVRLTVQSPWIAAQVTRYPVLLDELLDPRTLYSPLDRDSLAADLAERLSHVDGEDLEQQMDLLRHFKQINLLRVAAADASGALPLMVVSDYLTELAEVILEQAYRLAWANLVAKHGKPRLRAPDGAERTVGFAIIGYGKLGGIELGYGSDLDIVFLHESAGEALGTDGERSIDNGVFFARLGQRIIHILATPTPAGVLYEVDTRLRPSGNSGLLVSNLAAFAEYQRSEAWTWEHQALVRARLVAGDPAVGEAFGAIRLETLTRKREAAALRAEVAEMRARMRESLARDSADSFDLKQGVGGIADIEFVVQYSLLASAHQHPDLVRFTDNIRQLGALGRAGLLHPDEVRILTDAYRAYRSRVHSQALREEPAIVPAGEFADERAKVATIWNKYLGAPS